jgi:hypothetical protein
LEGIPRFDGPRAAIIRCRGVRSLEEQLETPGISRQQQSVLILGRKIGLEMGTPWVHPKKVRKITLWRFPMIFGIPKIMNSKIGFSLINHPFWSILGYPFWETSTPHFQSLDAVTSMAFWGGLGLELSDQRTVGAQQLDEQTYPFSCG